MAARAIWKATVEFGDIVIPVKLYSAIQDSTIRFRLLDDRSQQPVKQRLVDPTFSDEDADAPAGKWDENSGSPASAGAPHVPPQEIRKGAPVGPGRYVLLSDEELAAIEPKESRRIEVFRFIPLATLDHAFYNRAYWLGADGEPGLYAALVESLAEQERQGIARWVMRKHAYLGALRVRDNHLMLITLRHIGEVVGPQDFKLSGAKEPDPREIAMARQLVGMLEDTFDPHAYHDEYRDRVLALIERKRRGETVVAERPKAKSPTADLARALEKSIAAVGGMPRTGRGRRAAHG